jgi:hypothetical protein
MNLDYLATLLADRLSAIVPAGFHVAAQDGMLQYSAESVGRSGTYIRDNFGVYGESDRENIVGVAVQALDELQDYISEATHMPWPGEGSQPSPHGRILDSHLDLWYGDNERAILVCEPIPLPDIV